VCFLEKFLFENRLAVRFKVQLGAIELQKKYLLEVVCKQAGKKFVSDQEMLSGRGSFCYRKNLVF
jgi:hypothetical protein